MSTDGIVGILGADHIFIGRYVHADADPVGAGNALLRLIARDGAAAVLKTLSSYDGWSTLVPDYPDLADVTPDMKAKIGSPQYLAAMFTSTYAGREDGFAAVPGYGVAYTSGGPGPIHGELERHTLSGTEYDGPSWSCPEWTYLLDLTRETLTVGEGTRVSITAPIAELPTHWVNRDDFRTFCRKARHD